MPPMQRVMRLTSFAEEERGRPRFDEFIGCLTAHGVEFVIVGAYALAIHGAPPPVQIHVMSAISGVEWAEVWADRLDGPLGRHTVTFLGRETFLRNKRAAARPKDLADIEALQAGRDD